MSYYEKVVERQLAEKDKKIEELQRIVRNQAVMLQQIYASAGYKVGEAVTVPALLARLRGDK